MDHIVRLFEFASSPHIKKPEKGSNDPDVVKKTKKRLVLEDPLVKFKQVEQDQWDEDKEI